MLENATDVENGWTYSHPYVFLAPKAGRIVKTRFCTETPMTGVVYLTVVKYTQEYHQGKWGDYATGIYPFANQAAASANISGVNSRVFERVYDPAGSVVNFVAGDALYLIVKLPTDTWILNAYSIIDWS